MNVHPHLVTVACDTAQAFELFTSGMGQWWDPSITPCPESFEGITVEPHVGGRVAVQYPHTQNPFGVVLEWDPGEHYAQSFWLDGDPDAPSELDVRFSPDGPVCTIALRHRSAHGMLPDPFDHWPHLLSRFATAAAKI